MLVVVSDLHLQHTAFDSIRYRRDDGVYEAGVRRNVTASAFTRMIDMIDSRVIRHGVKQVDLMLAGDIFEIHRTPLWFMGIDNDLRPTIELGANSSDDQRLRKRTLDIFDAIVEENAAFFAAVRDYVESKREYRVQLLYVPGNHDRLLNAWPSVRRRVREALGMPPSDAPFPIKIDFSNYGARVRHGHEYDRLNFPFTVSGSRSLKLKPEDYLQPCFGDYVTVDVAARLATAFRVLHATKIRSNTDEGEKLRRLYQDLTEFDDVRPQSLLFEYLTQKMGADRQRVFLYLRPVLRDMVEYLSKDDGFVSEAKRLKIWNGAMVRALREALKSLSAKTLTSLLQNTLDEAGARDRHAAAEVAQYEPELDESFDVVVAGHSHRPDQIALPTKSRRDQSFYLNSGTWRSTIRHGVTRKGHLNSFGRLRGYTMVFCYDERERAEGDADGRRFETWTGHLAWSEDVDAKGQQAAAYDEAVEVVKGATVDLQLRFQSLRVIGVEEDFVDGAELELHFGVDDQGRTTTRKNVFDGDVIDLSDTEPIALDPALDGEVWAHGLELDWGSNPLNPDDPLPWAVDRLVRDENGQFIENSGLLSTRGQDEVLLELKYRVEKKKPTN